MSLSEGESVASRDCLETIDLCQMRDLDTIRALARGASTNFNANGVCIVGNR